MKSSDTPATVSISIEEAARLQRMEAECFRLRGELESLTRDRDGVIAHLNRLRGELAQYADVAAQKERAVEGRLEEGRSQSLAMESVLRMQNEEILRLRTANEGLLEVLGQGDLGAIDRLASAQASADHESRVMAERRRFLAKLETENLPAEPARADVFYLSPEKS